MLTVFRYFAIMLCALALALGLTHALAVTPSPRLAALTVALQVMATLCALVLTIRCRRSPGFWLALFGTIMLFLGTLVWGSSMAPVLVAGGAKLPAWATSNAIIQAGYDLPGGNIDIAALSIWLVGMSCLVLSAIRQPAAHRTRARGPLPLMRETLSRM